MATNKMVDNIFALLMLFQKDYLSNLEEEWVT